MTTRPTPSYFGVKDKDKPLCFGAYVEGTRECQVCAWQKECMEQ